MCIYVHIYAYIHIVYIYSQRVRAGFSRRHWVDTLVCDVCDTWLILHVTHEQMCTQDSILLKSVLWGRLDASAWICKYRVAKTRRMP